MLQGEQLVLQAQQLKLQGLQHNFHPKVETKITREKNFSL
jgi:hypothetical protein